MLKSWGLNKEEVDVVEIRNPKKEQDGGSACDEVEKKSGFHPSLSAGARVVPPLLSGPRRMQSFAPVEIPLVGRLPSGRPKDAKPVQRAGIFWHSSTFCWQRFFGSFLSTSQWVERYSACVFFVFGSYIL